MNSYESDKSFIKNNIIKYYQTLSTFKDFLKKKGLEFAMSSLKHKP